MHPPYSKVVSPVSRSCFTVYEMNGHVPCSKLSSQPCQPYK